MLNDHVKYLQASAADLGNGSCTTQVQSACCLGAIEFIALASYAPALQCLEQAIAKRGDCARAHSLQGYVLSQLGRHELALESCDRAIALAPASTTAHNHRGIALAALGRLDEAMGSYSRALSIDPRYAPAYVNLGSVLNLRHQAKFALLNFDAAILLEPQWPETHARRAYTLELLGQPEQAWKSYDAAYRLKPDHPYLLGDLIKTQLALCNWVGLEQRLELAAKEIEAQKAVVSPWIALTLFDSPSLQKTAAQTWDASRTSLPALPLLPKHVKPPGSTGRIRLAYFSPDFRDHAVARFTEGLFDNHDHARFELFAFSFGPGRSDQTRKRLETLFDHFIDVQDETDQAIVQLARAHQIDIAVDLCGYTQHSRAELFKARVAPIQIGYLGYAGTSGTSSTDYLLADKTIVPPGQQPHYSEKIIYLPECYLANDPGRPVPHVTDQTPRPHQNGSPFVFCCLTSCEKILPETFNTWMRVLAKVPNSVIHLRDAADVAKSNLRDAAASEGIDPARLVFLPNVPLPEYLARLAAADLFLDTYPYNAHSTASDALWSGLPVLTRAGKSYASRVAASLLNALNLPELIVTSTQEYESLAVSLAGDPERLLNIKAKLSSARFSAPLFDIQQMVTSIEAGITEAYDRYQNGLAADHIFVSRR